MFFVRASYCMLFAFFICCYTVQLSYCQQTGRAPKFMNGVEMGTQRKPEVIDTVIQFRKSAASIAQEAKQKEVAGIKDIDSTSLVSEVDSIENKDTLAVAITPAPPVYTEHAKPAVVAKAEHTIDESLFEGAVDEVIEKYAGMIDRDPHEINNYPLYKFIDKWYGTKYKWGGTDNNGIDCSALSQKLYESVFNTAISRTSRQQYKGCERIKDSDDAKEGDLVFFRIRHIRVSHVGVYLANGYFVHSSRSQGVVISNLSTPYWHRRYASCGKVQRETKAALESEYTVHPTE